ncbi:MAG: restriction endonuclease [Candidatus Methylumidiphilus sp.]
MAIPDFQSIMLPLLKLAGDGQEHSPREVVETLARHFQLTEDESKELLPSGRQTTFSNRISWAKAHMKMALLLEKSKHGIFRITLRGMETLKSNPPKINIKFLEQFPEYSISRNPDNKDILNQESEISTSIQTPEEALEASYQYLRQALADELLQTLKNCTPVFFESLVVDVLVKMGYGGTRQDAGRAVGKSGDGGIDGIIKEDRLGLDIIYLQAKRWEGTVGRPEVQKFAGALMGNGARKGVFITTSSFTKEAVDYVSAIDRKIILIDGETLAKLMIDYNVGVTSFATYEIKKVDLDYFSEV